MPKLPEWTFLHDLLADAYLQGWADALGNVASGEKKIDCVKNLYQKATEAVDYSNKYRKRRRKSK